MAVQVAIDGPAGAGKSTISRAVAQELGFVYIDTGAMYRAVGLAAARGGVALDDGAAVDALLADLALDIRYDNGEQRIFLEEEDVSEAIRTPEMSMQASRVSAIPAVREKLLELQRSLAASTNVIMDGRDIGTVVLPDASIKIFLTASCEDRARRRYEEMIAKGMPVEFDRLKAEIEERDKNDSSRATAPLKAADDAAIIDTSGNTLEASIALLTNYIKERMV